MNQSDFNYQAFNYHLKASLKQQKQNQYKLFLEIEDLVDQFSYSKQFTQKDIGKAIHKKAQLKEMFQSPQLVATKEREEGESGYQTMFGDVVYSAKKTPCFKVDAHGVITIYVCFWKATKDELIKYESVLDLEKKRRLQTINIQMEKLRQLDSIKQKKQQLEFRNKDIETQTKKISKQYKNLQSRCVTLLDQYTKKQQQQLSNRISVETDKLSFYENLSQLKQLHSSKFRLYPYENRCKVVFIGKNPKATQFIFNSVVNYDHKFSFKTKICKSFRSRIMVGIVDEPKQINERNSYNSGNAVCYGGYSGRVFPRGLRWSDGRFQEGQTVETKVDLKNKIVEWYVEGNYMASSRCEALADKSRIFRPFVEMQQFSDEIEVTFEQ